MIKALQIITIITVSLLTGCYSAQQPTSSRNMGDARNWVLIMHGEACGNADDVASNMYVENSHDSATINVVVDISWTVNNVPQHENKSLSVGPNSKSLIGCDLRNGVYLKMEIVSAAFQ